MNDNEINKTIKCEISLNRIFFPKYATSVPAGEFAIFSGTVEKEIENCSWGETLKFKGNVPELKFGAAYKVIAFLAEHHEQFGDTYEIIYMTKKINISQKEAQKELLSSILPDKIIENLFNMYDDVLSLIENRDVQSLCKVKGIKEAVAERIFNAYDEIKDYSLVYLELNKSGLTGNMIKKITDYYHSPEIALEVIRNKPYDLIDIDGIGFKTADSIALKMGIGRYDYRRIKACMIHILKEQAEIGKSYLTYSDLIKQLYDNLDYVPEESIAKAAQDMIEKNTVWVSEDGDKIALMRYYNLENSICNELIRLINGTPDNPETQDTTSYKPRDFSIDNPEEIINSVEEEQGFEFTDEQKQAIYTCLENRVIAITGSAGTGKTSTAKGICTIFKGYNVVQMALSGKAAVRLSEATGLPASTIHRALGYSFGKFMHDKDNKLPDDIIIVDEATMINGSLFLSLLQAIPSGAKVIILGDVQQLTPIGNCQVFADMLNSNIVPSVRLTKLHRQAMRSGIIPTSMKITKQEQLFTNTYQGSEIIGELQDMEMNITTEKCDLSDYVIEKFNQEYEKLQDITEVQVISPTKLKGSLSCYNLNTKIQSVINPVSQEDLTYQIVLSKGKKDEDKKIYYIKSGDKVINTKNNYHCIDESGNITPVYNGNIGIVKEINYHGAYIDFVGIGTVWFSTNDMKNIELGYCISIHKSQGSGFKSVIVAMDNGSYIMHNAELLYTAITRAKSYCCLVATNSSIRNSINKKEVNSKQTFLKDMLIQSVSSNEQLDKTEK